MIESKTNTVNLQNVSAAGLAPVLDYMYGVEELHINMDNAAHVLNAASLLMVEAVVSKTEHLLLSAVNEENYLEIRSLLKHFSLIETLDELDRKFVRECSIDSIIFGENGNTFINETEEVFVKLLKCSPLSSVRKVECIYRYINTVNTYINNDELLLALGLLAGNLLDSRLAVFPGVARRSRSPQRAEEFSERNG